MYVGAKGESCTSSSEGPALGPGLVRSLILKPVRLRSGQSKSFLISAQSLEQPTPTCSYAEGVMLHACMMCFMTRMQQCVAACDAIQALPWWSRIKLLQGLQEIREGSHLLLETS